MHLAIPFILLMGSYVVAAPSIQHAQINVEITNMDAHSQVDALYSSEGLVMNQDGPSFRTVPFNFTLSAKHANGSASLHFGFKNLNERDGSIRGELGFSTEFALLDGQLITGNRALGYHSARRSPPWTSLWPFESHPILELVVIAQFSEGGITHQLKPITKDITFGAHEIKPGEPVFVSEPEGFESAELILEVERIEETDNINADSAEELL